MCVWVCVCVCGCVCVCTRVFARVRVSEHTNTHTNPQKPPNSGPEKIVKPLVLKKAQSWNRASRLKRKAQLLANLGNKDKELRPVGYTNKRNQVPVRSFSLQ